MGLADRHYMRDAYHVPRLVNKLIVVLIVAFVIESLLIFYGRLNVIGALGLTVEGVRQGRVWQLLTFQFLHSAPWPFHVLFNCLGLYFFGRPVEEMLGSRRFLGLYFLSGVMGGLLQLVTTAVLPQHADIPVVGASAGVCGMIAIFCSVHPMRELTVWVMVFPITIRARSLLIFLGLLSLFGTLVPFDYVAHAAHLGGILIGLAYVRWGEQVIARAGRWEPFQRSGRRRPDKPGKRATGGGVFTRRDKPPDVPEEEFISREVDPILDKIHAHGIHSLTEQERRILERARSKMGKR